MRVKKFIKLINSERVSAKLVPGKACSSDTSFNDCNVWDKAECTVNSYDVCQKDLAACYNQGYDYCTTTYDTDACIGSYDYN